MKNAIFLLVQRNEKEIKRLYNRADVHSGPFLVVREGWTYTIDGNRLSDRCTGTAG